MNGCIHDSGVDAAGVVDGMLSPNLALAFMGLFEGLLSSSEAFKREGLTIAKSLVVRQVHVLRDDSAPLSDVFLKHENDEIFHALIKADSSECISDLSRVLELIDERLSVLEVCDER